MQKQPPEVFCRKRFSQNFCKFQRKTLVLECIFNKVCKNFVKKRLQHSCFAVKFAKYLRTPALKNICQRLLLYIREVVVQCCFQTLFSVLLYIDKKGTDVLRLRSRINILFENILNKLRKKTRFYPCRASGTTLHRLVMYLMLIKHVLFSIE